MGRGSNQRKHAPARSEFDEGFTALWQSLMIATEPTPADDPGKRSLDDPPLRQGTKAWREKLVPVYLGAFGHEQTRRGNLEAAHKLDSPAQVQLAPSDQRAVKGRASTIGPGSRWMFA